MFRFLIIYLLLNSFILVYSLYGNPKITFSPNESVPKEVILENDSLLVKVQLGRYVYFTSFRDKISNIEFVNADKPAPVVKINSQWHLLQVGFNIWQVSKFDEGDRNGVQIELFSDYLENPSDVRSTLP